MAQHNEKGKLGEKLSIQHLKSKGYLIIETNWRSGRNEVDIIAKDKDELVFVEVKTRNTVFFGLPESFVSNQQQKRMALAAENYCINKGINDANIRYDIIAVIVSDSKETLEHFEDAFFPDLGR
jgi:putative endonuclease